MLKRSIDLNFSLIFGTENNFIHYLSFEFHIKQEMHFFIFCLRIKINNSKRQKRKRNILLNLFINLQMFVIIH